MTDMTTYQELLVQSIRSELYKIGLVGDAPGDDEILALVVAARMHLSHLTKELRKDVRQKTPDLNDTLFSDDWWKSKLIEGLVP